MADRAVAARAAGKARKAEATLWRLEAGALRLRCVRVGTTGPQRGRVEVRQEDGNWSVVEGLEGDPLRLLTLMATSASVCRALS